MRLPAPALAPAWHAANVLARSGSVASSEVRLDDADSALDLQTLSFLVGAAALWGTYPTCVKLLYSAGPPLDPSIVVLLRFIIMAAVSCSALFATTPRFTLLRRYVTAAEAASMAWSEQLERRVPASVYVAALEPRCGGQTLFPDESARGHAFCVALCLAVFRPYAGARAWYPRRAGHLPADALALADPGAHRRGAVLDRQRDHPGAGGAGGSERTGAGGERADVGRLRPWPDRVLLGPRP